jgi:diketogulonate reductase-like aldo/keto reductase
MENLVRKGYTRSIGVSNYNVQSLLNLLSFCEIKPVVNQVELHPYNAQENLQKFAKANNIYLMAYNSICKGAYAKRYYVEINLLEEYIIKQMAQKYNMGAGHIALNWALLHEIIVIPATSNPKRMAENLKSFSFSLSQEDQTEITFKLDKGFRFNNPERKEFSTFKDLFA